MDFIRRTKFERNVETEGLEHISEKDVHTNTLNLKAKIEILQQHSDNSVINKVEDWLKLGNARAKNYTFNQIGHYRLIENFQSFNLGRSI